MTKDLEMSVEEKISTIQNIKSKLEDDFVSLGQLLSELKRGNVYKHKGYKTFKEFVEDEFKIAGSFANKLISNFELFIEELDIDEFSVKSIGLDKLNMIKPMVKDCSITETEEWIQKAETMPTADLREDIKQAKENKKQKTMKEVLIEQFRETFSTFFNCSQKELMFKLALYFQDADLEPIRLEIKKKQRQFESHEQEEQL